MDIAGYAGWNPALLEIDRPFAEGQMVRLTYARTSSLVPHVFVCRVHRLEHERAVRWTAPDGVAAWFFAADHGLSLVDGPTPGTTAVTHDEHFSGLLAPLLLALLRGGVEASHRAFNAALVRSFES